MTSLPLPCHPFRVHYVRSRQKSDKHIDQVIGTTSKALADYCYLTCDSHITLSCTSVPKMPSPVSWRPASTLRKKAEKRRTHEDVARQLAPEGTASIVNCNLIRRLNQRKATENAKNGASFHFSLSQSGWHILIDIIDSKGRSDARHVSRRHDKWALEPGLHANSTWEN